VPRSRVLAVSEVRAHDNQAIGMAIAKAASIQSVPVALQTQRAGAAERGRRHQDVCERCQSRALDRDVTVSGAAHLAKGASVASLVHRAALLGMSGIDP
jgi:hypothetical protein